jgi:predicted outer membrane protein
MNKIRALAVTFLSVAGIGGPALAQTNSNAFAPFNAATNVNQLTNLTALTGAAYLQQVAAALQLEGELGQLAMTRSQNPTVQHFGQRLMVDDGSSLHNAQTIATEQGITLHGLAPGDQTIGQSIGSLMGVQFDRGFIGFVITNNLEQINLAEQAVANVVDPAVRNFAFQQQRLLWFHLILAVNIGDGLQPPVTVP